jgi:acetoin utilization protein AcuC
VERLSSLTSDTVTNGLLYRDELKGYDFGIGHPFRGDRYRLFRQRLSELLPEDNTYRTIVAEPAADDDLLLICSRDYIRFTMDFFDAGSIGPGIMDRFARFHSADNFTNARPGHLERAARIVVGQAKRACDLVQSGEYTKVISIGGGLHHAKKSYGEGFCLYNDVAFCGLYLQQQYRLKKILILDTDAHDGNGTMEYFYADPNVLFIDIHQDPHTIYPGTGFIEQVGEGEGKGFTVNIPLPVRAGDDAYELVFDSIVAPLVEEFQPEIIIRNGGSDPHYRDQLTSLGLSLEGFRMIGRKVRTMSSVCDGKVIDLIASGYNLAVLPYAWLSLISALTGVNLRLEEPEAESAIPDSGSGYEETLGVVNRVSSTLKNYWHCFR